MVLKSVHISRPPHRQFKLLDTIQAAKIVKILDILEIRGPGQHTGAGCRTEYRVGRC